MAHRITINFYNKTLVTTDLPQCTVVATEFLHWLLNPCNHLEQAKNSYNPSFWNFLNINYYAIEQSKSKVAIYDKNNLFTQSYDYYSTAVGISNYLATVGAKFRDGYDGVVCMSDLDDSRFRIGKL